MSNLKHVVIKTIAGRARTLRPAAFRSRPSGYTLTPEANLLPGLDAALIMEDYATGDGGELRGDVPKFCAAHSSAALAANAFGPFRRDPRLLSVGGIDGLTGARFERPLRTGLPGNPPNLDFYAAGPSGVVAVESKFTEVLEAKEAVFAASYKRAVARLAEVAWARLYKSIVADPKQFVYLDAAQLIKHYLGIRYSLGAIEGPKVLLYAYWEPSNAGGIPEYAAHRAEVAAFASAVSGSEVRFVPVSYPGLWASWAMLPSWRGAQAHVAALRARYDVELPSTPG